MAGIGPITNTRTLKGALTETVEHLERARQKPVIVRMLRRCREYRQLVDEWDAVSPPPDEQFETIGQIMQLLGAAMQAVKQTTKDDPDIEIHTFEPLEPIGDAFRAGDDEVLPAADLELDLVPASSCAQIVELYREPWRASGRGIYVKTLRTCPAGRHHALVRLDGGAEIPGQKHESDEHIYVLNGCVRHAGVAAHAGACIRIDAGSTSGPIKSLGETTLLFMDSERRSIKF